MKPINQSFRAANKKATTSLEFLLVFPIFIGIFMAVVTFGQMMYVKNQLTSVAREACRTAILPGGNIDFVNARMGAILNGATLDPDSVYVLTATPDGTVIDEAKINGPFTDNEYFTTEYFSGLTGGDSITISVQLIFNDISLMPDFIPQVTLDGTITMRKEGFGQ